MVVYYCVMTFLLSPALESTEGTSNKETTNNPSPEANSQSSLDPETGGQTEPGQGGNHTPEYRLPLGKNSWEVFGFISEPLKFALSK